MSKRRRTTGFKDIYYQDWHFHRTLDAIDTPQEWKIIVPRPLRAPPAGRYYAVELHSVTYEYNHSSRSGINADLSLTYSPRLGKTPFKTHAGHPENLWWSHFHLETGGVATSEIRIGSTENKSDFTDHLGHGKLITGENIWLQLGSTNYYDELLFGGFSLQYTFTTVPCSEYVQELVAQLTSV